MLVMQETSEIFLLALLLRKDLAGRRTVSIEPLFYSSASVDHLKRCKEKRKKGPPFLFLPSLYKLLFVMVIGGNL